MTAFTKALVVIDPEQESQPALDRVLQLEKRMDLDIKLIACDYTQYLVEGYYFDALELPKLRQAYLDERKTLLEGLAQPLRDQGLNVETEAFWSHPAYETIIEEVYASGADLVVLHTRRHGALSRMFLTNDDWQMVRSCPVPLLLVKEKEWPQTPKIVVGVDPVHDRHKPDGLDHKLLNTALMLEDKLAAELHVLHSYNQIPLSGTYMEKAEKQHQSSLTQLMSEFNVAKERIHLSEEAAEFAISELEHEVNASLVVMGAISRSLLSDVFIGNTTERVVDQVACDVLVLKPDGYVSPIEPNANK